MDKTIWMPWKWPWPIRMHHFSVRSFIIPCELAARRVLVLGRQATADKNSELSSSGRDPLKCSGSIVRWTSNRYFISGRSSPENKDKVLGLRSFWRNIPSYIDQIITFIVNIKTIILRSTSNVVTIGSQSNEILFILMTSKACFRKGLSRLLIAAFPHF